MTADKLHRLLKVTLSQCETCPLRSEEAFREALDVAADEMAAGNTCDCHMANAWLFMEPEAQTALAHGLFRAFTQR